MIISVALGVAVLTAVIGFRESFERVLTRSGRELIAADLAVRLTSPAAEEEFRVLRRPVELGAEMTSITETYTMTAVSNKDQAVFTTIKAVDPLVYPFYGKFEVDSGKSLRDVLNDETAVVNQEFLAQTRSSVRDRVQLGSAHFRIAAVVASEPDRLSYGIELGPRAVITQSGLARSGIEIHGIRAAQSFLYKLPERGLDRGQLRTMLTSGLRRAMRISDFRDPSPAMSTWLEQSTEYLALIALIALILGGIGISSTVDAHIQEKLDHIAIMKCLGARSSQVTKIYLVQMLAPGLGGSVIGVLGGFLVQRSVNPLVRRLLDVPAEVRFSPLVSMQGLCSGIFATLLFLLPSLLVVRNVRPVRLFLRNMPENRRSMVRSQDPLLLVVELLLAGGAVLLAAWLTRSWWLAVACLAAMSFVLLSFGLTAKLLVWSLTRLSFSRNLVLRTAVRNLRRPGSRFGRLFASVGLGAAAIMLTYLVQESLVSEMLRSGPADYPNFFLAGISESQKGIVFDMLARQPGVQDTGRLIPAIPARLEKVDRRTSEDPALDSQALQYFQNQSMLTWAQGVPPYTRILSGEWWKNRGHPQVSVSAAAARALGIGIGSRLEFLAGGSVVAGEVANVRETEFLSPANFNDFIFSPGALAGVPGFYVGTVRVAPSALANVRSYMFRNFPNVTFFDLQQALTKLQEVLDTAARIVRTAGWFAMLSGLVILVSTIDATRRQRTRETAILRSLGATRRHIRRVQAAEFLITGFVAGAAGGLLANAAANYLLKRLLHIGFALQWKAVFAGAAAIALLAFIAGCLGTHGVLRAKPMEVLREE